MIRLLRPVRCRTRKREPFCDRDWKIDGNNGMLRGKLQKKFEKWIIGSFHPGELLEVKIRWLKVQSCMGTKWESWTTCLNLSKASATNDSEHGLSAMKLQEYRAEANISLNVALYVLKPSKHWWRRSERFLPSSIAPQRENCPNEQRPSGIRWQKILWKTKNNRG